MKDIEDHGFVLDIGLPGVSGFLRYNNDGDPQRGRRRVGSLVNVVAEKFGEDGRTCLFVEDDHDFKMSSVCLLSFNLLRLLIMPPPH